jgi:hypothetical protein
MDEDMELLEGENQWLNPERNFHGANWKQEKKQIKRGRNIFSHTAFSGVKL